MKPVGIRRYLSLAALLAAGLLFVGAAGNCGTTVPPDDKPDKAVKVQLDGFQVKRDAAKAWATLSTFNAFDQLTSGSFQDPAISNWQVTTDSAGQALLCPDLNINTSTQTCQDVACRIYVYVDSVFGAYPCSESGSTACSFMGSQALADCHMTISTLSASATGLGTWYSLTYLWDSQMTLIVAGEGAIEVTPIVELEFVGEMPELDQMDPVERALATHRLEISKRVPGPPVEVQIADGQAKFLYTAPNAKLEELGLDPMLPDRVWHPTDQLEVLVKQFGGVEPQLVPWVEQIWEGARLDGIELGPGIGIPREDQLSVVTFGEPWQDPAVQESILYGVDWSRLTDQALGAPARVQVARQEPTGSLAQTSPDARVVGYDPGRAQALMAEAGYDSLEAVLLVPAGDDELLRTAELLQQQLAESGVKVEIEIVPQGKIQEKVAVMSAAGVPGIVLTRR